MWDPRFYSQHGKFCVCVCMCLYVHKSSKKSPPWYLSLTEVKISRRVGRGELSDGVWPLICPWGVLPSFTSPFLPPLCLSHIYKHFTSQLHPRLLCSSAPQFAHLSNNQMILKLNGHLQTSLDLITFFFLHVAVCGHTNGLHGCFPWACSCPCMWRS